MQQRVKPPTTTASVSPTLDSLFARTAARHPDALALCDPANKSRITGQSPLRLTYAQADRAVSALAAQFEAAGLPPGSVIAVQLPNTIEYALTLLGAWRAGLIVNTGRRHRLAVYRLASDVTAFSALSFGVLE